MMESQNIILKSQNSIGRSGKIVQNIQNGINSYNNINVETIQNEQSKIRASNVFIEKMEERIKSLEEENLNLISQYNQSTHLIFEYSKTIQELNKTKNDLEEKLSKLELNSGIRMKEKNTEEGIRQFTKGTEE